MNQRKLTDEEFSDVMQARYYLRKAVVISGHPVYSGVVLSGLDDMATHGTTDGRPYVEPAPEIGEGYREATEADKGRLDREMWNGECWLQRVTSSHEGRTYRVPVGRIPTDEDAKQRPTVMVRDYEAAEWKARVLLAVTDRSFPFVAGGSGHDSAPWRYCRFPYPGELDQ